MSLRSYFVVGGVCASLLGAALLFSSNSLFAQSPVAPRLRFEAGQRWAYELDWSAQTSGQMPSGAEQGAMGLKTHLQGIVWLEVLAPHADGAQLAVSLAQIERFDFELQGQAANPDLAATRAVLEGQRAIVELDERGRVQALSFAQDASPTVRATLRSLVLQLGFVIPEKLDTPSVNDEPSTLGTVTAYSVASATQIVRTPQQYTALDAAPGPITGMQTLSGRATILLDAQGGLLAVDDVQHLVYVRAGQTEPALDASWTFMLHRTHAITGTPKPVPAQLTGQKLNGLIGDEGLEARRDSRMSAEMSMELLSETLERFERGTPPGHEFLVRAGAFLRIHPEALAELVAQFASPTLSGKGRGLLLDVMVEAGDAPAQAAMRAVLGSAPAHESSQIASRLMQRFSFLRQPNAESIDFLAAEAQRARQSGDLAAAQGAVVALGSCVRSLEQRGELGLAEQTNARLRAEVREARNGTSLQKRGALAALGNAARAENLETIVDLAHDEDPLVRDQVAAALRSVDSPRARSTLLELASEGSTAITLSALSSLNSQTLAPTDWQQLAELVSAGKMPASADGALLRLVLDKRAEAGSSGRQILLMIVSRGGGAENDLIQRAEQALAEG